MSLLRNLAAFLTEMWRAVSVALDPGESEQR
jgi:hypothetical protein